MNIIYEESKNDKITKKFQQEVGDMALVLKNLADQKR